jgi:hypothetical protein
MAGATAFPLFAACLCALVLQGTTRELVSTDVVQAFTSAQGSPSWLNCTPVHKACSTCRNQRVPGTKKTETLCSACKAGWKLRRDGKSKTCGAILYEGAGSGCRHDRELIDLSSSASAPSQSRERRFVLQHKQ